MKHNDLLNLAIDTSYLAGEKILDIYNDNKYKNFIEIKKDASPLTIADKASNDIIVTTTDPITEQPTNTTIVSNSILVSGSVSFTPTVAGAMHFFSIEATDANGDVTTAQSANSGVIPS